MEQQLSFEQSLRRLEEIVKGLERGDVPLEEAMRLFREGTELVGSCTKQLDAAELEVVRLMKGADGQPTETEFPHALD